jgi:hypothetical protein
MERRLATVPIDSAIEMTSSRASGTTSTSCNGTEASSSSTSPRVPAIASNVPTIPPADARSKLSMRSCLITRPRDAPIARRTPISLLRAAERTATSVATLAQATMSTNATMPINTPRGTAMLPRICESPRFAGRSVTPRGVEFLTRSSEACS